MLNVAHSALPKKVRESLRNTARYNPGALFGASAAPVSIDPAVQIGPDGLFHKARKLADLPEIVTTYPRSEVLQISVRQKRGSRPVAFAAGLVGFILGTRAAMWLGFKQCRRSCADEGALMLLSLIGLPIASGAAGYRLAAHSVDVIVYHR